MTRRPVCKSHDSHQPATATTLTDCLSVALLHSPGQGRFPAVAGNPRCDLRPAGLVCQVVSLLYGQI